MVKKTTQTNKPDVVVIESQIKMADLNMYRSKFEGLPMGMYKVQYICPYYVQNMTVSWDGENLV